MDSSVAALNSKGSGYEGNSFASGMCTMNCLPHTGDTDLLGKSTGHWGNSRRDFPTADKFTQLLWNFR